MNSSAVNIRSDEVPHLNSICLQNAVLCAECDVVSDSPHDHCLVCGSRSLFNISRLLGGKAAQSASYAYRCCKSTIYFAEANVEVPENSEIGKFESLHQGTERRCPVENVWMISPLSVWILEPLLGNQTAETNLSQAMCCLR